ADRPRHDRAGDGRSRRPDPAHAEGEDPMTTNDQVREQERRALYHLAQLAVWPRWYPTFSDAMADYAQKALTEIAALSPAAPPEPLSDERLREVLDEGLANGRTYAAMARSTQGPRTE